MCKSELTRAHIAAVGSQVCTYALTRVQNVQSVLLILALRVVYAVVMNIVSKLPRTKINVLTLKPQQHA